MRLTDAKHAQIITQHQHYIKIYKLNAYQLLWFLSCKQQVSAAADEPLWTSISSPLCRTQKWTFNAAQQLSVKLSWQHLWRSTCRV